MKKFNTIKEFINYAPECIFCGSNSQLILSSIAKQNKKDKGIRLSKNTIWGEPLRKMNELTPNFQYHSKICGDVVTIICKENQFYNKTPAQTYDIVYLDINTSEITVNKDIQTNIIKIFSKLKFQINSMCSNSACKAIPKIHSYDSTFITAGAKSQKIMPFFLRTEAMILPINPESKLRYILWSDYSEQISCLSKVKVSMSSTFSMDVSNMTFLPEGKDIELPLLDMSVIKSQEMLEDKIENYITFS